MPEIISLGPGDRDDAAAVLERAWPGRGAATVCAEKLEAPGSGIPLALGIRAADRLGAIAVIADRYLRLLAVDPDHRGRGFGSALLERAAAEAPGPLIAAAEPGNYLTPGIDAADAGTLGWLERRGFVRTGEAADLEIDLADNPRVSRDRLFERLARIAAAGYRLARAGDGDRDELEAHVASAGGRPWTVEILRALEPPSGVFIARDGSGQIAGFAAHDGNNRGLGGFGPAAVAPRHRRRGLGEALLLTCLIDVARSGQARCTVGWVGPRDFYERAVGVAAERCYIHMQRRPRS